MHFLAALSFKASDHPPRTCSALSLTPLLSVCCSSVASCNGLAGRMQHLSFPHGGIRMEEEKYLFATLPNLLFVTVYEWWLMVEGIYKRTLSLSLPFFLSRRREKRLEGRQTTRALHAHCKLHFAFPCCSCLPSTTYAYIPCTLGVFEKAGTGRQADFGKETPATPLPHEQTFSLWEQEDEAVYHCISLLSQAFTHLLLHTWVTFTHFAVVSFSPFSFSFVFPAHTHTHYTSACLPAFCPHTTHATYATPPTCTHCTCSYVTPLPPPHAHHPRTPLHTHTDIWETTFHHPQDQFK